MAGMARLRITRRGLVGRHGVGQALLIGVSFVGLGLARQAWWTMATRAYLGLVGQVSFPWQRQADRSEAGADAPEAFGPEASEWQGQAGVTW